MVEQVVDLVKDGPLVDLLVLAVLAELLESPICNVLATVRAVFVVDLEGKQRRVNTLFRPALGRAVGDGCCHGFANSRIPTYASSDPRFPQEQVAYQPQVPAAIAAYLAGGEFPSNEVLRVDPMLAIYYRFTKCQFLWIVPDFAPDDTATGGIRTIMFSDLT